MMWLIDLSSTEMHEIFWCDRAKGSITCITETSTDRRQRILCWCQGVSDLLNTAHSGTWKWKFYLINRHVHVKYDPGSNTLFTSLFQSRFLSCFPDVSSFSYLYRWCQTSVNLWTPKTWSDSSIMNRVTTYFFTQSQNTRSLYKRVRGYIFNHVHFYTLICLYSMRWQSSCVHLSFSQTLYQI